MHITEAKRELYTELKKTENAVTGAGIKQSDGMDVIVIYISSEEQPRNIPENYKGNKVITEISENPKMV